MLRDLLASEVLPTVRLTDIYRQAEGSSIVELAHDMKKGLLPKGLTAPTKGRSFIRCNSSQIKEVVDQVVSNALKKGYTSRDIQVLARCTGEKRELTS